MSQVAGPVTVEAFLRGVSVASVTPRWVAFCDSDRVLISGKPLTPNPAAASSLLAAMLEPYEYHEEIEELGIAAADLLTHAGTGGLATRQLLALGEAVAEVAQSVEGDVRHEFERRLRLTLGKFVLYVNVEALRSVDLEARRDGLTGLRNRRAFDLDVARLATNGSQSLAIAFLDVDGLKQINDRDGHLAGDELLKRVAKALAASCAGGEYAYRFGGDEYAYLSPLRSAADVVDLMSSLSTGDTPFSFGVASLPDDSADADEVVRLADQRMYECKAERKAHHAEAGATSPFARVAQWVSRVSHRLRY